MGTVALLLALAPINAAPAPAAVQANPTGTLEVPCVLPGGDVVVFGEVDDDGAYEPEYRLKIVTNSVTTYQGVSESDLENSDGVTVGDAAVGSTIELQYRGIQDNEDYVWTRLDGPHTVRACQQPSGQFTTECTSTGARADVGALSVGDYPAGTFSLVAGAFSATVTSNQQDVTVPPSSTITLQYARQGDANRTLDTEQSPAPCPEKGTVDKTSSPASGSVVAAGSTVDYSVTVANTGLLVVTNKPVVDTLPALVTVSGAPSDGGSVSGDGRTITWTVTLLPGASKTLTYRGLVSAAAPATSVLLNAVRFLDVEDSTSHTVGSRDLAAEKAVAPTGAVEFGATLTYTLTVRATGNLPQSGVVVTDTVPAGTTYVPGSAACDVACPATFADGIVRWELGSMAAGDVRTVSFRVTVDTPEPDENGGVPAVDIRNAGAVASAELPTRPSNEVVTEVAAVLGVKTAVEKTADSPESDVLAASGSALEPLAAVTIGVLLVLGGVALAGVRPPGRRRRSE